MVRAIDWRFRPPLGAYVGSPFYAADTKTAPDEIFAEMDVAGITMGVCPFRKGMDNGGAEKLQTAYPKRLRAFIYVDPWNMEQALQDIDQYVIRGTAAGVCMEPGQIMMQPPVRADAEMLFPIYEKCEKEGILLSMTFGGMLCRDPGLYNPSYIAHVCDTFPKLKIVAAHGGWPWVTGICHVAYNHEFLYISPDIYLARNQPGHLDYVAAANNWLQDKMLFGTAYVHGHCDLSWYVQEYQALLSEEVLDKVLYRNAAGLLGLEPAVKYHPIG